MMKEEEKRMNYKYLIIINDVVYINIDGIQKPYNK